KTKNNEAVSNAYGPYAVLNGNLAAECSNYCLSWQEPEGCRTSASQQKFQKEPAGLQGVRPQLNGNCCKNGLQRDCQLHAPKKGPCLKVLRSVWMMAGLESCKWQPGYSRVCCPQINADLHR